MSKMTAAGLIHKAGQGAPVRLCCGRRHAGVACPDGKVQCCLCFGRFAQDELHTDADGQRRDVCVPCGEAEGARRG